MELIKTKVLNIVFFVPNLDGGIGQVMSTLARGLQEQGKNIEVWSASGPSGYANELEQHVSVLYLGNGSVLAALIPLIRKMREQKPETLLSAAFHTNCVAMIASLFFSRRTRLVITDHPSIDAALFELTAYKRLIMRLCIRILYPRADIRIAVSEGVAQAMAKYGGISRSNIHLIPNPVISDKIFTQSQKSVSHPFFETTEPVFLYVGRLSKEKDVTTLLNAFILLQTDTRSRLLIIGDGPERLGLEKIVERNQLQELVAFLGHQDNPYPYFVKSDVFVLSSRREGLPTVLIEALALGMKVVSTDCPSGPREVLRNGKYGALVPVGDSLALAKELKTTLNSQRKKIPRDELRQYYVDYVVASYVKLI